MSLTLIVGPMKSGKSLELIARVAPYEYAMRRVIYVQPDKNIRDSGVSSRAGVTTKSVKVSSLTDVRTSFDVIGIDEIHMFPLKDIEVIANWVDDGKDIFVSGLDLDYRAKLMPIIAKILELKPELIINKVSVCDVCHSYTAQFTQLLNKNKPILGGLSHVVPEDGTLVYQARCRKCFKKASSKNS